MSATVAEQQDTSSQKQKSNFVTYLQLFGPYLSLITSMVAMLGSLYYSEIMLLPPCTLCWYQRILMYPLNIVVFVGIVKQDEYLPFYILPSSILGIFVSSYHYLIQLGVIGESTSCTLIACNTRYVNYFGFVTIPFMALTAFIIITVVMGAVYWAYRQDQPIVDESNED